jgi:hypothetical protein
MFDKIKYYLIAFGGGIVAAFMLWVKFMRDNNYTTNLQDPFKPLVDMKEKELEEIDVKLKDLKENGVEDLTDSEILDYWNKN